MALLVREPFRVGRPCVDVEVLAPLSTSTTRSRCFRSPYASFVPSGDHSGPNFQGAPSVVSLFGVPVPSPFFSQISYSPDASER
jgi:hypothetical protein